MSVGKHGGRGTPPIGEGASKRARTRRSIVNKGRRSQHEPHSRCASVLITDRKPGNVQRRSAIHPRSRATSNWITRIPIRLPVTSSELEAIERLLGRELRHLLQRTKEHT